MLEEIKIKDNLLKNFENDCKNLEQQNRDLQ